MKTTLLSIFTFTLAALANAQCADLFISEYVEGSGNNKALELYNPTPNAISLNNNYRLVRYNNGTSAAAGEANSQAIVNLGNPTIASGATYVIVIDKRDASQPCPGQECAVDAALQAKANAFLCPDYNVSYSMYFNGNDAVSLQKFNGTTWNYVDIFGMMGDPAMVSGVAWSDAFPYDGSAGTWWTVDHTLVRKASVQQGVTANPSPQFIVTTEWDSLPRNTYTGLGTHTCTCPVNASGINAIDNSVAVNVFPNPSTNNSFTVSATEAIKMVEVYNALGQNVISEIVNNNKALKIDTQGLTTGMYFVKVLFDNRKTSIVKLSIQ